ncbi:hypothetical protein BKX93_03230 [Chromobacterium vaccinii]|uniref:Uncharacterized protein n=1 Tax=Chromobacterium vaccinii TaxID=1108595 RepID=A0A1D9LD06_9NEIS|nr:hypothetical protein BKX93_03230 [Chromobacterium vaccinii]
MERHLQHFTNRHPLSRRAGQQMAQRFGRRAKDFSAKQHAAAQPSAPFSDAILLLDQQHRKQTLQMVNNRFRRQA